MWNRALTSFVSLFAFSVSLAGCGDEGDNMTGNGNGHSAVVRFILTPSTARAALDITGVAMTFHSFEPAGNCTTVLYDADDGVWGDESFARFQIPDDTYGCIAIFEAGIQGYFFLGDVNQALLESGTLDDLVAGTTPFATGYYSRVDDGNVTGTFEFYVDELST